MKQLKTPLSEETIKSLKVGDPLELSGYIYTGRDAVLPKLVKHITDGTLATLGVDLAGSVIFHTAVSPAGVGPTSSNKFEIESSIPVLSEAGVKIHLGKGKLSTYTVNELQKNNSVYAVIPPITALLESKIIEREVVAFPEQGMEALHRLKVEGFPCIIAIANGETIY